MAVYTRSANARNRKKYIRKGTYSSRRTTGQSLMTSRAGIGSGLTSTRITSQFLGNASSGWATNLWTVLTDTQTFANGFDKYKSMYAFVMCYKVKVQIIMVPSTVAAADDKVPAVGIGYDPKEAAAPGSMQEICNLDNYSLFAPQPNCITKNIFKFVPKPGVAPPFLTTVDKATTLLGHLKCWKDDCTSTQKLLRVYVSFYCRFSGDT